MGEVKFFHTCGFCKKNKEKVDIVIVGYDSVCICNDCIKVCVDIIKKCVKNNPAEYSIEKYEYLFTKEEIEDLCQKIDSK